MRSAWLSRVALPLLAVSLAPAAAPPPSDVSVQLQQLAFYHEGLTRASSTFARLEQCSGFSECLTQWTCGSPRDELWDATNGTDMGAVAAPPMGLRSAVPLGGIGAGTFELRGDGSFADWMIENQGTALAANQEQNSKVPTKSEALLGLYASGGGASPPFAAALRTTPPAGVPGVEALAYSGAHPFSRLALNDSRAPLASAAIFAYTSYKTGDANASGLPLVAFSLLVSNAAGAQRQDVSLLLSLPLSSSLDTARPLIGGDVRGQVIAVIETNSTDEGACLAACEEHADCTWWSLEPPQPYVPPVTMQNHDCAGDDIYTPPRIAVATLEDCIAQCVDRVPGCRGLVFDQIAGEQQGQCGNSDPGLFCCLPKTSCTDFSPKVGDSAWSAGSGSPNASGVTCTLYRKAPAVEQFFAGSNASSGVRGAWASAGAALTLRRTNAYDADPGAAFQDPAAATGSFTLLAVDGDATVTFSAANSLAGGVWPAFAASGRLPLASVPDGTAAAHGAVAALVSLAPGETRTITIVFAWHFANRTYVGQEIGNFYAGAFADSLAVAQLGAANLTEIASAGLSWNRLFSALTLADNWKDFFINTVSTQAKMSVWVARDRFGAPLPGGRFRQFEAYSGCDLAPVHVLDYSMLPYVLHFPELLQNTLLTGWAEMQQDDGMVKEFLGDFSAPGGRITGQMDLSAGGRTMGDVTSVFILATLACVQTSGDTAFLNAIWPAVVRATQWQIARSHDYGCPSFVQTTYDYLGLDAYPLVTYNAVLHLAAMRAAAKLAALVDDKSTLAANATLSEATCLAAVGAQLWSDKMQGWRAYQTADGSAPDLVLSGALHGQSWASAVGLGLLLPASNATRHVATELRLNCAYSPGCELGPQTLPGRSATWSQDASPSMSMDATASRVIFGVGGLAGSVGEASVALYRERHHSLWHWMDLHVGPEGLSCGAPLSGAFLIGQGFVNSHYARHSQAWAALLAATGQRLDAVARTLSFAPICEGRRVAVGGHELVLPFFSPAAVGLLTVRWAAAEPPVSATLRLLQGRLPELAEAATVDLSRCGEGEGRHGALVEVRVEGGDP